MSWLESLVKAMFKGQHVNVEMLPQLDAYRVSVLFTAKDLAIAARDPRHGVDKLRALVPKRRKHRRLHWGKKR